MATSTMRRAYGVKILNSNHKDVRRLKREGYVAEIHGNKFWNTTYIAMSYLKKHPLEPGSRVLDLGCGWGLLGIYCADNFDAEVTGIDADANVLPYLDLHAELNGVEMEGKKMSFEQLTVKELKKYDVLVGVEICFWTS
ncbi:MAG: class I SAM-dependent methyltransferase [Gammaproteobacteria bacterium]|nr:class I SAM-dependent methyltransferase [Gammaproteobacteria bacterium]